MNKQKEKMVKAQVGSTYFYISRHDISSFMNFMLQTTLIDEPWATAPSLVPAEPTFEYIDPISTEPLSARELRMQAETRQRSEWWRQEQEKNAELQNTIKSLEERLAKAEENDE